MRSAAWIILGVLTSTACSTVVPLGEDDSTSTTGGSSTSLPSGPAPDESGSSSSSGSSSGLGESGQSTGAHFLSPTEDSDTSTCDGQGDSECSLVNQDCCAGEACKPWANDGGSFWNASRCSSVPEDPAQRGQPCWVTDSSVSGIDTCDVGLMCWGVDSESLEGTCFELCSTDDAFVCGEPDQSCFVSNSGALPLCLTACDPLEPACGEGLRCSLSAPDAPAVCVPQSVSTVCSEGTVPVAADEIPGCPSEPCCATLCDPAEEDACGAGLSCWVSGDGQVGYCRGA